MKHEILCASCVKYARSLINKFPVEWVEIKEGSAKRNFVCDNCNRPIEQGENCFAFSCGPVDKPYYPWESNFIDLKEVKP